MAYRTSQSVPTVPETPVIPFPGTKPAVSEADRLRCAVDTTPCVGGQTFRMTYYDAELAPRIECVLDVGVSEEDRLLLRRLLKSVGDSLRPASFRSLPLRLLAGVPLYALVHLP